MPATVRPLRPSEREQWEPLWRGYLDFYETSLPPQIYDLVADRSGFIQYRKVL